MSKIVRLRRLPRQPMRQRRRKAPPRALALALIAGGAVGYLLFDALPPPSTVTAETIGQAPGPADAIAGRASVIDGDTIEIHGTRVRLHGIDAPESAQLCLVQKKEIRCGQQAALALSDWIGRSAVACEPKDRDRYGRIVAVCRAQGEDLNAWMVAEGWAMAYREYSSDYIPQEQVASAAKLGIWAGEFVAPWEWRRGERMPAEVMRTQGSCVIKGNLSSRGERIYHVPGGEFYERTQISPDKGERWFCTEAEAQAAGWRRSKR